MKNYKPNSDKQMSSKYIEASKKLEWSNSWSKLISVTFDKSIKIVSKGTEYPSKVNLWNWQLILYS